jgi:hypothetical protein
MEINLRSTQMNHFHKMNLGTRLPSPIEADFSQVH